MNKHEQPENPKGEKDNDLTVIIFEIDSVQLAHVVVNMMKKPEKDKENER